MKSYKLSSTRKSRARQVRLIIITCFVALTLGGLIYTIITKYFWHPTSASIQFVAADHGQPIKTKPDQSLNPRMPHADKLIYNELDNQGVVTVPENTILELPEQPDIHQEESISPFLESDDTTDITVGDE